MRIDIWLMLGLLLLGGLGLMTLYSASGGHLATVAKQSTHLLIGFGAMLFFAQIAPRHYYQWAPWLYAIGLLLLITVSAMGYITNGAQRWLNLGLLHIQPSELMKVAVPMSLAWYLDKKQLPPNLKLISICVLLMLIPTLLTIKQPDLGTGIIIAFASLSVLLLAGLNWKLMAGFGTLGIVSLPLAWHMLHSYQRQRILTFLNPERDPLGTGYHIIQSKIAIGSGGLLGKGFFNGTQAHLQFLPEHSTDFIFAVFGEEFGFIGTLVLVSLFAIVIARCFSICYQAHGTFNRLLAGSLTLTFFISFFINMGMVSGIIPVVGIPLPLISYGGSSIVTTLAGLGILMSIHTHRPLLNR